MLRVKLGVRWLVALSLFYRVWESAPSTSVGSVKQALKSRRRGAARRAPPNAHFIRRKESQKEASSLLGLLWWNGTERTMVTRQAELLLLRYRRDDLSINFENELNKRFNYAGAQEKTTTLSRQIKGQLDTPIFSQGCFNWCLDLWVAFARLRSKWYVLLPIIRG